MIGVLAVLACAMGCVACSGFGERVADSLYGDLDVPIDRETAITVASYPPSADIRVVIGGKGEGLDCSIPGLLEDLMFERIGGIESSVVLQFRQPCVYHDLCYRHGYATYGYTQADCDFALLQQAFRTCVQVYEFGLILRGNLDARGDSTEICRKRAREVLLGVRIGGRGSFMARDRSTYFEFDPFPIHADDYVVARLLRVDPEDAPVVDGVKLIATPTVLRFKRGRVLSRQLRWTAEKHLGDRDPRDSAGVAFPQFAIPTPPNVVRASDRDWLLWINRGSAYTTGFNVFVSAGPMHKGAASLRPLPCPEKKSGYACDFDASVIRAFQLPPGSSGDVPFIAFTHRFADKTDGRNRYESRTVGLHWWNVTPGILDGSSNQAPVARASKLAHVSHNRYRYLQSEIQLGEFRKRGCDEIVALGRGITVDAAGDADEAASDAGTNFRDSVAVGFIPLQAGDCPPARSIPMALPQPYEPAFPVSASATGNDELLSIVSSGDSQPLRFIEYRFDETSGRRSETHPLVRAIDSGRMPVALDSSWMRAAAQVVRKPGGGDLLFFWRAVLEPDQRAAFDRGDAPDTIRLEFRAFDARGGTWTETAFTSCSVDLIAQHAQVPSDSLDYRLYSRLALEGINEGQRPAAQALFSRLHRRELARRWMQSQVIPGYMFDRGADDSGHPLDVAVIFHDSADYSVLLKGAHTGADVPDRFDVAWPRGDFGFITCGATRS